MNYLITYGIKPTPAGAMGRPHGKQRYYHFEKLKVGGSMFVPCASHLEECAVRSAASLHNKGRKLSGKLTTRITYDKVKGTWGIWVHCVRKT